MPGARSPPPRRECGLRTLGRMAQTPFCPPLIAAAPPASPHYTTRFAPSGGPWLAAFAPCHPADIGHLSGLFSGPGVNAAAIGIADAWAPHSGQPLWGSPTLEYPHRVHSPFRTRRRRTFQAQQRIANQMPAIAVAPTSAYPPHNSRTGAAICRDGFWVDTVTRIAGAAGGSAAELPSGATANIRIGTPTTLTTRAHHSLARAFGPVALLAKNWQSAPRGNDL